MKSKLLIGVSIIALLSSPDICGQSSEMPVPERTVFASVNKGAVEPKVHGWALSSLQVED